jgi:hypothetical protein
LVVTGPDTGQESVRLAWFALEHSAGFALTVAGFFGQKYLHGPSQRELVAASRELQEIDRLNKPSNWERRNAKKFFTIRRFRKIL